MAKVMNPPQITNKQIGKIQDLLGAALRKAGLVSEPVQTIIETCGKTLVSDLVGVIRKHVEAVSNLLVRRVKVNRTLTPEEMLKATGRAVYADGNVVKNMPKGEGEEAEVIFFQLGRYVSDDDLEKEYDLRGLKPADPYSLGAVNKSIPPFADSHPNGTHWKDAEGKWCYATFYRFLDDRDVYVYRGDNDWNGGWWFAGLRK